MQKKLSKIVAALAISASLANAGNVLVQNYGDSRQLPVLTAGASSLATSGIAAVGSFSSDPTALIANLGTDAGYTALLAAFSQFGSVGVGGDVPGLYGGDTSRPVSDAASDPFNGKDIYTIIGNAATLVDSTHIAIIKDNDTFGFDNPTFERTAEISDPTSVVLFGNSGGPGIETALGQSVASLELREVSGVIPEPMSALFIVGSAALGLRRKRK